MFPLQFKHNVYESYHAKVGMMLDNQRYSFRHKGFTLIELIVVIILLGIMSLTVSSRFFGASGFVEYTYQARLVSALRNMQIRAMHDNRSDYCFKVNFQTTPPAYGPPLLTDAPIGNNAETCQNGIDFTLPDYLATTEIEMTQAGVSLSAASNGVAFSFIDFNNMGQPSTDGPTCDTGCIITLTGESTVSVCVESEGYIHACN
jgi:MSHA pilin protein MshC